MTGPDTELPSSASPEGGGFTIQRKHLVVIGVVLALAVGILVGLLASGGGSDKASNQGSEVFLEPTSSAGQNPFMASVGTDQQITSSTSSTSTSVTTGPPTTNGTNTALASFPGDTPGLYGGTRSVGSCDPEKLVSFLEQNPDKAAAWAQVIGIQPNEIRSYVATLTPVLLRSDTRVTNHGFENGHATTVPAVLQAGTAVLVDPHGRPVTKCFCGNPLGPPTPLAHPVYTGPQWTGFTPSRVTVVVPTTVVIKIFVLVDIHTGQVFGRPAGTPSTNDVNVNDTTGSTPTTTPATRTVAGTYTVQFQGPLSGPCTGWPVGTGSMTLSTDPTGALSILLTYPSGFQRSYRGSLITASGAFDTPDIEFGRNPLTGTLVPSQGTYTVTDGREHTQNTSGTECIGGFTARQQ